MQLSSIEEIEVKGPKESEAVLFKVVASGVCHGDASTLIKGSGYLKMIQK